MKRASTPGSKAERDDAQISIFDVANGELDVHEAPVPVGLSARQGFIFDGSASKGGVTPVGAAAGIAVERSKRALLFEKSPRSTERAREGALNRSPVSAKPSARRQNRLSTANCNWPDIRAMSAFPGAKAVCRNLNVMSLGPAEAVLSRANVQQLLNEVIGKSEWIVLDQRQIDQFASASGDDYWLHTDVARTAADPRYGSTIAQGFLLLSLCAKFSFSTWLRSPEIEESLNYGTDRVRFLSAARSGNSIRGIFRLASINQKSDREFVINTEATIELQNQAKPAMVGNLLTFVRFK